MLMEDDRPPYQEVRCSADGRCRKTEKMSGECGSPTMLRKNLQEWSLQISYNSQIL